MKMINIREEEMMIDTGVKETVKIGGGSSTIRVMKKMQMVGGDEIGTRKLLMIGTGIGVMMKMQMIGGEEIGGVVMIMLMIGGGGEEMDGVTMKIKMIKGETKRKIKVGMRKMIMTGEEMMMKMVMIGGTRKGKEVGART